MKELIDKLLINQNSDFLFLKQYNFDLEGYFQLAFYGLMKELQFENEFNK